jgi:hypothetical protein
LPLETAVNQQLLSEISSGMGEPLTRAARRFPSYRRGRPVTLGCLVRWIHKGTKGPDGSIVRLEAARCSGRWLTTPGAIERFLAAQTPEIGEQPPPSRPPATRRRAAENAARQLASNGI